MSTEQLHYTILRKNFINKTVKQAECKNSCCHITLKLNIFLGCNSKTRKVNQNLFHPSNNLSQTSRTGSRKYHSSSIITEIPHKNVDNGVPYTSKKPKRYFHKYNCIDILIK